jgi:allophanate hydrolase subunit 1
MIILFVYHIVAVAYCMWRILKRYKKSSLDGVIGTSPGLDTLAVVFLAPLLMPLDLLITLAGLKKKKESA